MLALPFLVATLIGEERYKILWESYWLLAVPYVLVCYVLFHYWAFPITWARLVGPVWGEKQTIPIEYDPKTDAERRRRIAADGSKVTTAIERRDAEFLYKLGLEYEQEWFVNEAIDMFKKAADVDPTGAWGVDARARLREIGMP